MIIISAFRRSFLHFHGVCVGGVGVGVPPYIDFEISAGTRAHATPTLLSPGSPVDKWAAGSEVCTRATPPPPFISIYEPQPHKDGGSMSWPQADHVSTL